WARISALGYRDKRLPEDVVVDLLAHAVAQAESGFIPSADDGYKWDTLGFRLIVMFKETFGSQDQLDASTPRNKVASFLAYRAPRRVMALTNLFRNGMYSEAVPLVRSAYEDWVTAAYLLLRPGEEHCREFWYEDQLRLLAKWYRATQHLLPAEDVDRFIR